MAETSKDMKNLYVVILCGGGGTRLWPRSRQKTPKQFINLTSRKTLYEEAISNIAGLVSPERILIITNHKYLDEIKEFSPQIPEKNIISEPEKRSTALAMGVASAYAYHLNPEAVVINIASDHLIKQRDLFRKTVLAAAKEADKGKNILAVGIKPNLPHTGYGYIRAGEKVSQQDDLPVFKVESFKEKPDKKTAEKFLKTGQYFWNANLYTWKKGYIVIK